MESPNLDLQHPQLTALPLPPETVPLPAPLSAWSDVVSTGIFLRSCRSPSIHLTGPYADDFPPEQQRHGPFDSIRGRGTGARSSTQVGRTFRSEGRGCTFQPSRQN